MCIQVTFGASKEEVESARWETVRALLGFAPAGPIDRWAAQAMVSQLAQIQQQAGAPQEWGHQLGQLLLELNERVHQQEQAVREKEGALQECLRRCDILDKQADYLVRCGVEARTKELADNEQTWRQRVRRAEAALAAEQGAHQADVEELKEKITQLNRIVVELQQALNETYE